MKPTQELIDAIYRDKVLRARRTPFERKLLGGLEQFVFSCELMKAGIRNQYPEADAERVRQILIERLALARRLERLS